MILGAILAGGQSRRFGSDKAMALLDGLPLIAHVSAALEPWVDAIAICGREGRELALPDRPVPGLGPLGGIAAALHCADTRGFGRVLTMPCDTPAIDPATLERLTLAGGAAFVAHCPVIGIWPAALAASLDDYLAGGGDRAMYAWASRVGAEALDSAAPINVNRPADLELLGG